MIYDLENGTYSLYVNDEYIGEKTDTTVMDYLAASDEDAVTFAFKHAWAQQGQYFLLDDIYVTTGNAQPTLALYQDASCETPLTELAGTVYAKMEDGDGLHLLIGAYDENGELLATAVADSATTALEIPEGCAYVRAYAWELSAVSPATPAGTVSGSCLKNNTKGLSYAAAPFLFALLV